MNLKIVIIVAILGIGFVVIYSVYKMNKRSSAYEDEFIKGLWQTTVANCEKTNELIFELGAPPFDCGAIRPLKQEWLIE